MTNEYHDERKDHAPGPWRVLVSMPLEFRIVADTWKGELTLCQGECLYRHNATMMAAAPDMYDALDLLLRKAEDIDNGVGQFGTGLTPRQIAEQAMKKAKP